MEQNTALPPFDPYLRGPLEQLPASLTVALSISHNTISPISSLSVYPSLAHIAPLHRSHSGTITSRAPFSATSLANNFRPS
ncbi:hypothetical protein LOAG_03699 [Loa loa]|uniref:Uncharacterized protein n=1 Tax=Loa loa TaxID=7209 RepID=A0A1I7VMU4_LOALO|nr:hypothetical protein LOAG_03699 [Loa loa]EFO24786.2 hypothetical protein LOAG_03699 [Loa loa]